MTQPTNKSPAINNLIKKVTGYDREKSIEIHTCMTCNNPDMNFRTELDFREYRISGMCQKCQDETFGTGA